jgi:hypothetical protein
MTVIQIRSHIALSTFNPSQPYKQIIARWRPNEAHMLLTNEPKDDGLRFDDDQDLPPMISLTGDISRPDEVFGMDRSMRAPRSSLSRISAMGE